jgi:membrane protease YdiL (CAAX protease family)
MSRDRLLLGVFLGITFAISLVIEVAMLRAGGLEAAGALPVLGLMWTPGLVALGMRAAKLRGLPELGFRLPAKRWLLIGYLLPLAVALVSYGAAWATGLAPVRVPEAWAARIVPLTILVNATVGFAIGCVFALGEEIGWRGLMVPLLVRSGVRAPLVVSGIVWGAWHTPLILFGDYATSARPAVSAALFMVSVTGAAVSIGWVRVVSGSVWPAMVLHASHNAFFQSVFDRLTGESPTSRLAVGESGALPALVYAALAGWLIATGRVRTPARGG